MFLSSGPKEGNKSNRDVEGYLNTRGKQDCVYSFTRDLKPIASHYLGKRNFKDYEFMGNFQNGKFTSEKTSDSAILNRIDFYFYSNKVASDVSALSVKYLFMIGELCKKNKLNLIAFNTPHCSFFYENIPPSTLDGYTKMCEDFKRTYPNVVFKNYCDLYPEKSLFSDGDHLNVTGANRFTPLIADLIPTNIKIE